MKRYRVLSTQQDFIDVANILKDQFTLNLRFHRSNSSLLHTLTIQAANGETVVAFGDLLVIINDRAYAVPSSVIASGGILSWIIDGVEL